VITSPALKVVRPDGSHKSVPEPFSAAQPGEIEAALAGLKLAWVAKDAITERWQLQW